MTTTPDLTKCQKCEALLPAEIANGAAQISRDFGNEIAANSALCPACAEKWDREIENRMIARDKARRQGLVSKLIPELYLATDVSRFPARPHREALNWKFPNGTGLWIEGTSGTRKSRLAYELIRLRILDGTFSSVEIVSGMAFSDLVAAKWADEAQEKAGATAKLARAATSRLLYIDDLDKFRPTTSALNALLYILEERTKHRLPTMITTQANAATLLAKMVEAAKTDHTEPPAILRRLMEHTVRIVTQPPS